MRKHTVLALALLVAFVIATSWINAANADSVYQEDVIEHGKYIATISGCTACHTPLKAEYQNPQTLTLEQIQTLAFNDLAASDESKLLAGGRAFDLGPSGIVFTRNITPDTETGIGAWTDDQIKLAMKSGIRADGKALFPVMPYHVYNSMADADVEAVIAYLRSAKALKNTVPERTVSTEGLPALPFETGITAPGPQDLAARGGYLVNSVMGCTDCHTAVDPVTGAPQMEKYLAGRQPYEGPWGIVYGGNITPDEATGIGTWSEEEIKRAIVSGIGRDGRKLILMPWYSYAALTEADADAIVYYLKNVLPAVSNSIPAASLNPDFVVMAPQELMQRSAPSGPMSPLILIVAGVGIILLVTFAILLVRRKTG